MCSLRSFLRNHGGPLVSALRTLRRLPDNLKFRWHMGKVLVPKTGVMVCYLTRAFPASPGSRWGTARGGAVKLMYLAESIPHSGYAFNILYVVSSVFRTPTMIAAAKRRGVKVVWNQNGVYYPGWYGPGWEEQNAKLAKAMSMSDYVIYQSQFCKFSADKFLGKYAGPQAILYNPVDVNHYFPRQEKPAVDEIVILTLANRMFYRLECALRALAIVRRPFPRARMIIPGFDGHNKEHLFALQQAKRLASSLGLQECVTFLPPYNQKEAPAILNQAHILLHPTYNDASPNLVPEAMACGLPVVYSASGGVPEMVDRTCGIGIPAPQDWNQFHSPDPELLAKAVLKVAERWESYSQASRQQAVKHFSVENYVANHRYIFEQLANHKG